jgi:hypothetical protein
LYPVDPYPPEEDQVYVEPQPSESGRPDGYWYYCESAHGYYPRIAECPEDWIKVPPTR